MEAYLKEQYNVIEDKNNLKVPDDIIEYFSESTDAFDCGQGYYTETANKIVLIDNKFYLVTLKAEITSAKQDRGDRLYWVEDIYDVSYKEISKPVEVEGTCTITIPTYLKEKVIIALQEANIDNYTFRLNYEK